MPKQNEKSPLVAPTTREVDEKLLLYSIEQGVQSILLRDKYIRVLLTVQIILTLYLIFK